MTYKAGVSAATLCTATITRKKNRAKSYGDPSSTLTPLKFFLKDGEEFEVELFNPFQDQVLAKIKVNGNYISESGIILMPGQRVFLERFIDTNEKFTFKTYEVDGSKEAMNAIAKNGQVIVEFYHERPKTLRLNSNFPGFNTYVAPFNTIGGSYYGGINLSNTIGSPFNPPIGSTLLNGSTITSTSTLGGFSGATCYFSSSTLPVSDQIKSFDAPVETSTSTLETGRISGGTASSQTFETVYGDFNAYAFQTASMQILPESQKPVEVSEIRNYCTKCGTRAKKTNWKFCPTCGESLK